MIQQRKRERGREEKNAETEQHLYIGYKEVVRILFKRMLFNVHFYVSLFMCAIFATVRKRKITGTTMKQLGEEKKQRKPKQ